MVHFLLIFLLIKMSLKWYFQCRIFLVMKYFRSVATFTDTKDLNISFSTNRLKNISSFHRQPSVCIKLSCWCYALRGVLVSVAPGGPLLTPLSLQHSRRLLWTGRWTSRSIVLQDQRKPLWRFREVSGVDLWVNCVNTKASGLRRGQSF